MNITELNRITKERDKCLYRLNQYTGALEELTYLFKNKYISAVLYSERFDKIKREFDKLSAKFKQLGDKANEL
jgi:hypothetical protein